MTDHDALINAAAELLIASITMRDLLDAMPNATRAVMPADIKGRVDTDRYQAAFDALPTNVQDDARALVDADPHILAARQL